MANLGYTCSLGALDLDPRRFFKSVISFLNLLALESIRFSDSSISSSRLTKNELYCLKKVN